MGNREDALVRLCDRINDSAENRNRIANRVLVMQAKLLEKHNPDVKIRLMYNPRWGCKIALAAWIGGDLCYDRRTDR